MCGEESNANPASPEVILFNIPGTGVHTIKPKTDLPTITDAVTIDGYSQPGASVNTLKKGTNAKLMIQLDGSTTVWRGLTIEAPDSVIKGLVIDRFDESGIYIDAQGANTTVGGNFIGADPSGTEARNTGIGVWALGFGNNTIGGSVPAARNLISGNHGGAGLILNSDGNEVFSNLIGTQKDSKSPLGNDYYGVTARARGSDLSSGWVYSLKSACTVAHKARVGIPKRPIFVFGTAT